MTRFKLACRFHRRRCNRTSCVQSTREEGRRGSHSSASSVPSRAQTRGSSSSAAAVIVAGAGDDGRGRNHQPEPRVTIAPPGSSSTRSLSLRRGSRKPWAISITMSLAKPTQARKPSSCQSTRIPRPVMPQTPRPLHALSDWPLVPAQHNPRITHNASKQARIGVGHDVCRAAPRQFTAPPSHTHYCTLDEACSGYSRLCLARDSTVDTWAVVTRSAEQVRGAFQHNSAEGDGEWQRENEVKAIVYYEPNALIGGLARLLLLALLVELGEPRNSASVRKGVNYFAWVPQYAPPRCSSCWRGAARPGRPMAAPRRTTT